MKVIKFNNRNYHNLFLFLILAGIFLSCSSSNIDNKSKATLLSELPQINDDFYPQIESSIWILISSSQFSKAYLVIYDEIYYTIAVNDINKVSFISTEDELFISPESLKIGGSFADVKALTKNEVIKENGWAYVILLKSGWNVAFVEGEQMTDGILREDSEISFFFKR